MSEHHTRSTEEVTAWCNKCQRVTPHKVSAGRLAQCIEPSHTPEIHAYWCDRCKAATPHEYNQEGRAACLRCDKQRTRTQQADIDFDEATAKHIAALDGMGNRGEKRREP